MYGQSPRVCKHRRFLTPLCRRPTIGHAMQPTLTSRRLFLKHAFGAAAVAASLPLLAACSSAPSAPAASTSAPAAGVGAAPASAAAPTTAPAVAAGQPSSINMMMNGGLYQE